MVTVALSRGVLVALEGVDGCGKTTQARLLAEALERRGYAVILTREPTDGPTGKRLRAYLHGDDRNLSPAAELQLFMVDRREHVEQLIKPALAAGRIVVTDRYYYSSVAYQGALGLDPARILAEHLAFAPPPDLVIILELAVSQALARIAHKRQEAPQVSEGPAYLDQVAAIYAGLQGPTLRHLDASQPEATVHALILDEVLKLLAPQPA